ncbi:MAG TPA: DNA recombination protein RmuC [Chthoniobacterales bacterium]|nr:DNA recombination protein RmuC [Chthoniobacterales bacterium]
MDPLLYLIAGVVGGGVVVGILIWSGQRAQRGNQNILGKIDVLEKSHERSERTLREELSRGREENANAAKSQREELTKSFESVRSIVDNRLRQLQEDNAKQIDKMRATVDEKLQSTLERRLGESFKLVSDRLEQVHRGLGAMQQLASDVGGLQKVLANVKTRGGWGEVQLGNLLEQVLTPDQFARNVKTREESGEHVEFAIKLPGDENGAPVWLPIDAKFPTEDYQRLLAAQDKGEIGAIESAAKNLETQLKKSAKDICAKYINPPRTTDFALMFLPTEGLFAEAVRRIGLAEQVQRECRVVFAGPTTLAALLNSLQMGFRTLAIQKRSSEVWNLLAGVKAEFGKFGESLSAVKDKLDQAARRMEDVDVRSRAITRRLNKVEELPANPQPLLPELLQEDGEEKE